MGHVLCFFLRDAHFAMKLKAMQLKVILEPVDYLMTSPSSDVVKYEKMFDGVFVSTS